MRRVAVWVLVVAACSEGPQLVGSQPSWRNGQTPDRLAAPVTFAPTTEPAKRYNEAVQAPPATELNTAITTMVKQEAKKLGIPAPVADARLFRVCDEIAEVVPENGVANNAVLEFALQRNGIIEPVPHLIIAWSGVRDVASLVDNLRPNAIEMLREGATARLGIGAVKRLADGTNAIVFAMQSSGVTTQPIPRTLPANGSFALDANVDPRYRDPEVFVTRDDGQTEQLGIKLAKPGSFSVSVACGAHTGKQQVEIAANGPLGSTVLANFPVWCGTEPPQTVTIDPSRDDGPVTSTADAEQKLFQAVNRERASAHLSPYVWDDQLAAVARGHSEDMHKTNLIGHLSPTTGGAADRVHAANIKTALVLENVARAYSVAGVHEGLMNSPGHRANIMSTSATNIGIGVVFGDDNAGQRALLVTEVFSRVSPIIDRAKALDIVTQKLVAARKMTVDPQLSQIAGSVAVSLAAGKSRDEVWPDVRRRLDAMGRAFGKVGSVITAVSELDSLDAKPLIGDYAPDAMGVGVAQGPHPEIGANAVWIVVLFAQKRPGP
jgi:uncharacterized protein YkwD